MESRLTEPVITVVMEVRIGGQPRHTIPIKRALELMAQAMRENGGDAERATRAIERAFDQLKRI